MQIDAVVAGGKLSTNEGDIPIVLNQGN